MEKTERRLANKYGNGKDTRGETSMTGPITGRNQRIQNQTSQGKRSVKASTDDQHRGMARTLRKEHQISFSGDLQDSNFHAIRQGPETKFQGCPGGSVG